MSEQIIDPSSFVCGGTGPEKDADESIQALVDKIAQNISEHSGKEYPHLKAIKYKSQIVAGINYFVKIDAGDEYIHARIYEKLPCYGGEVELHGIQDSKEKHDAIEYF
ncbi:cystatin-B-like [Brachionus plicatilis]|uniref:Cystatin-B-like n=1 Tax=Brachionus plicatilis TaxID=10195 RepID=A0A3M7S6J1_BRAPC|nr:cystatin-B-like [Brachionus plicatilis]